MIHLPNYHRTTTHKDKHWLPDDTGNNVDITLDLSADWPTEQRTTKAQNYLSNALYGGLFDYAGAGKWWAGMKEWVFGIWSPNQNAYGRIPPCSTPKRLGRSSTNPHQGPR